MRSTEPDWKNLYDDLVQFVHSRIKNKPAAEDIVQEVLIKIHTRAEQLKSIDNFAAWVYRITVNAVTDHFRKHQKSIQAVDIDWDTNQQELNECVEHCLAILLKRLPEKYRVALELTEIENRTQLEVAKILNISHAGARSRVQRARKMLRALMEHLYIIETDSYGNIIVCEDRHPCCCQ
jgi:RNA polymerase sigma-70 factor, ECF subfamily